MHRLFLSDKGETSVGCCSSLATGIFHFYAWKADDEAARQYTSHLLTKARYQLRAISWQEHVELPVKLGVDAATDRLRPNQPLQSV